MPAAERVTVTATGAYIAFLQFVFALGWTTYAIYLPKLAAEVGIAPSAVILILMLDQAIFTVTDTAMGIAADRMARIVGRLGIVVAILSAMSCTAFVALPFVARQGPPAQALFMTLIVIWSITSSALRAPPLTLLGRHRLKPSLPWLSALAMLGYGIAGAVSPYLGVTLRNLDPRVPFIISSVVLLLTAVALTRVERAATAQATEPRRGGSSGTPFGAAATLFIAGMLMLALGFQVHFSLNSTPFFLRFAKPADLEWLTPIFWVGFNLALFPASLIMKHRGALVVMGAAGLIGAIAVLAAERAASLDILIAAQFVAGAAWGCILMSAVSAALAFGEGGREGKCLGLLFSALALATFARMAAVAGGLQKTPDYALLLHWAPVVFWLVAGSGLLALAAARVRNVGSSVGSGVVKQDALPPGSKNAGN